MTCSLVKCFWMGAAILGIWIQRGSDTRSAGGTEIAWSSTPSASTIRPGSAVPANRTRKCCTSSNGSVARIGGTWRSSSLSTIAAPTARRGSSRARPSSRRRKKFENLCVTKTTRTSTTSPRRRRDGDTGVNTMRVILTLMVAGALVVAAPAHAHHSFAAEYDVTKPIEVCGTVTKVEWTNPHARFYVEARDETGKIAKWNFELGPPGQLSRLGWNRHSLGIGDQVTV